MTASSDQEKFEKRLDRERRARKAAEKLLEEKSAELFLANEHQRKSAERLQNIMDTVPDAILTVSDGVVRSWNGSALLMFGFSEENFGNVPLPQILHQDSQADDAGDIEPGNIRQACRADGTCFPAEVSITKGVIDEEDLEILVVRDLTARVAREEKTRELQEQLDQSQKFEAIGTLASGIAHEINTPIQYVSDNLRFLSDSCDDFTAILAEYLKFLEANDENETIKEQIGKLRAMAMDKDLPFLLEEFPKATQESLSGAEQVSRIVQAAKEFSHPGAGQRQMVNLNKVVENATTLSRNEWKEHAEVTLSLGDTLPEVSCLAAEVNQVILNIIINAAHALESKVGDGRIEIVTTGDDDYNEIRISDNGCGIPENIREKIFMPFFTTKGVGKGTGQGLAIAFDTVVNKHGGSLKLESEEDVGTTFIIRFPITAPEPEEVPGKVPEAVAEQL